MPATPLLPSPLQTSLWAQNTPGLASLDDTERVPLDQWCWLDLRPGWVSGGDGLLTECAQTLPWRHGRRWMYDRMVDEPRLLASPRLSDESVPPVARQAAAALSRRYHRRFGSLFCNYYRDGHDSVAWHADRVGHQVIDPLIAIISLGGPRTFALRPVGGGPSRRFELHSGDLMVMGGATQHRWEHCVPKRRHAGPRISLTLRHDLGGRRGRAAPSRTRHAVAQQSLQPSL